MRSSVSSTCAAPNNSAALVFAFFTSCKNDAQTLASNSDQTEEYVGKEISTDHDAEIDKLISQMTLEEKITFENQLQNDEAFKKQFELYKETNSFLKIKFSNAAEINNLLSHEDYTSLVH